MWLQGPDERQVALCYSMNVHPGETLDDVLGALEQYVVPLKARLGVPGDFAVGLRLAARAAEQFQTRAQELKDALDGNGLRAVTVNAFPYGDFHAERVKEEVYRPDWTDSRRAVYTLRTAVALAALNPRGARVSLSTVPLSFKAWRPSVNAVTGRLLELLSALQSVERKSGVRVAIGLEPEPFCMLETARETVDYWCDHLMPSCRAKFGRGADDLANTYLGVCLDTCHHAVQWEESAAAVDLYRAAKIPITKVQLSCALDAPNTDALVPFDEPRYLHQVVGKDGNAYPLDVASSAGPVRCHFHVPVHRDEVAGVPTTRADMVGGLGRALATNATGCLEIETYTWDVLPLKDGELLDSLEAEYRFVLAEAERCGWSARSLST